jgi:hypothetical protein
MRRTVIGLLSAAMLTTGALHMPAYAVAPTDSMAIDTDRIGEITIGMTVDRLYEVVGRIRTRLVDLHREGTFDPAVEIRMEDEAATPAIVANVQWLAGCGYVVIGLTALDSRFRLSTGIHVGSTLAEVRKLHSVTISREEGLHAIDLALRVGFELEGTVDSSRVSRIRLIASPSSFPCITRR